MSFAEENNQNALETNLAAAFRLLGEQANRIDTIQVMYQWSAVYVEKHLYCNQSLMHMVMCRTITVYQNSCFTEYSATQSIMYLLIA